MVPISGIRYTVATILDVSILENLGQLLDKLAWDNAPFSNSKIFS